MGWFKDAGFKTYTLGDVNDPKKQGEVQTYTGAPDPNLPAVPGQYGPVDAYGQVVDQFGRSEADKGTIYEYGSEPAGPNRTADAMAQEYIRQEHQRRAELAPRPAAGSAKGTIYGVDQTSQPHNYVQTPAAQGTYVYTDPNTGAQSYQSQDQAGGQAGYCPCPDAITGYCPTTNEKAPGNCSNLSGEGSKSYIRNMT